MSAEPPRNASRSSTPPEGGAEPGEKSWYRCCCSHSRARTRASRRSVFARRSRQRASTECQLLTKNRPMLTNPASPPTASSSPLSSSLKPSARAAAHTWPPPPASPVAFWPPVPPVPSPPPPPSAASTAAAQASPTELSRNPRYAYCSCAAAARRRSVAARAAACGSNKGAVRG